HYFLSLWYSDHGRLYYFAFVIFFAAALVCLLPFLIAFLHGVHRSRLILTAGICLFALPWAEWLQISTEATRENWSQQILFQTTFLYAAVLAFSLFPGIVKVIHGKTFEIFHFLSQKAWLLRLPPILFFLFAAWISLFVFRQTPVTQDSASHLFQAKILSRGDFYAPAPPVPDFFSWPSDLLVMKDGRWFSMFFPGFAALLALGVPLHCEWLISPLLGAATLAIWIAYARRWHSRLEALLFGLLGLFSPFLLVMSSTVMVHTPELFITSSAIYLCRRQTEHATALRNLMLFFVFTFLVLIRSFSSFLFVSPLVVYVVVDRIKARAYGCPASILGGILTGGCLLLFYQWKTTGDPFLPGYMLEVYVRWGFGATHIFGSHSPWKGLENVSNNVLGLNYWLTGWYSGALVFLIPFFLFQRSIEKWDLLLLLNCFTLIVFYYFFFIQDLFFGPRYYYVFAPLLLLLIARTVASHAAQDNKRSRVLTAVLVVSFLSVFPERLPKFIYRYNPSNIQAGNLKKEIEGGRQKTLVFLDGNSAQSFVNWNDPFLRHPVVLCRDLGERNHEAIAAFPDYRPVYFRMEVDFEKINVETAFRFHDEPERIPSGYLSLFRLAMVIVAAKDYPDRDFFDIAYVDFFNTNEAAQQLVYLNQHASKGMEKGAYRNNFRFGLIHAGRILLIPLVAFQSGDSNWANRVDLQAFEQEFREARASFQGSGEVGKPILAQLDRVSKRIDQNRDGTLSDPEVLNYLAGKRKVFLAGTSM
ncbi:MAG TPA: hypothetical protein VI958_07460, partial [Acidobacteriota bacterium]